MMCIYSIQNKLNNNSYIGSSIKFSKRKALHLKNLLNNNHHSYHLQAAWNKYGKDAFEFIILEIVDEKESLIDREQYWINNLKPVYNVCKFASSSLGVKRRPETIEKIRKANLGLKHPVWRNELKSKSQTGIKKKPFSEESKKKMSEAQKRLYANGYIHPLAGKKHKKESILKIVEKNSIPVDQFDSEGNFIKNYKSLKEASTQGFKSEKISACCRNEIKIYKNFIWKFAEKTINND